MTSNDQRVPLYTLKPGDSFKCIAGHVFEGKVVQVDDESLTGVTVDVKQVDEDSIKRFITGDGEQVRFATGYERLLWSARTQVFPK